MNCCRRRWRWVEVEQTGLLPTRATLPSGGASSHAYLRRLVGLTKQAKESLATALGSTTGLPSITGPGGTTYTALPSKSSKGQRNDCNRVSYVLESKLALRLP